jgi:hypothetical protein
MMEWWMQSHLLVFACVGVLCAIFIMVANIRRLRADLYATAYREVGLCCRFLSVLGWANTLGDKNQPSSPPCVSCDLGHACEHWWYRPDGVSDGYFGKMPNSDFRAVLDFSSMTMTTIREGVEGKYAGTNTWQLRWDNSDPLAPRLVSQRDSKVLPEGATEAVDPTNDEDWEDMPNGAELAYLVYLSPQLRPHRRWTKAMEAELNEVLAARCR